MNLAGNDSADWERELAQFDTPTICNALELINPETRRFGFTSKPLLCLNSDNSPVVGRAKTATIRSKHQSPKGSDELKAERAKYYRYIAEGNYPKIVVMQDLDGEDAGFGPFWGEFNSRVHLALGCRGVITDGAVRDIKMIPSEFHILASCIKPSHAFIHLTGYGAQVNVASMSVSDGELIHSDCHGAVTFPENIWKDVVGAAKDFEASEAPILQACKKRLGIDELVDLYLDR